MANFTVTHGLMYPVLLGTVAEPTGATVEAVSAHFIRTRIHRTLVEREKHTCYDVLSGAVVAVSIAPSLYQINNIS